jgi:hypothetical protein
MILARGEGGSCLGALTGALPAQAAIGRRQLTKLDEWVRIRRKGMPLCEPTPTQTWLGEGHLVCESRSPWFAVALKISAACAKWRALHVPPEASDVVSPVPPAARAVLRRHAVAATRIHPCGRSIRTTVFMPLCNRTRSIPAGHVTGTASRHRAVQSCNHRTVTTSPHERTLTRACARPSCRIAVAIAAEGVPCMSGVCSEIYLEKAFDPIRPAHRLPVAQRVRPPRTCAPLGTGACAAWCGSVLRTARYTAAPQRCSRWTYCHLSTQALCAARGDLAGVFVPSDNVGR